MLTLNDGRSELWQWDTGRTLSVPADCSQVHFSNKVFGRSIDVDVTDGMAIIPDILLQTDNDLNVWAFVGTAENGYTKISKTLKVNRRNKPADYVFTPPEQTTLAEIMERLDDLESIQDPDAIKNAVDDYLANNPVIVNETDPTVPEWAKQPDPPDVKIPDKLPNPYAINFTGAVNASYDGSSAVEIKIPDSGGNADQSGGGLSSTASALLIGILKNAVYTADQSANITALEVELALGGGSGSGGSGGGEASAYTVVSTLDNATTDNNASAVAAGGSYTATITPADGYELDAVTVLMGGVDVTADVYADGVITIESVTGNVIIKVTTVEASDVLYKLAAPVTFTGTEEPIDTYTKINAEDIDYSICVKITCGEQASMIYPITDTYPAGFTLRMVTGYNRMMAMFIMSASKNLVDDWRLNDEGQNILVVTHTAGTGLYSIKLAYPTKEGHESNSPVAYETTAAFAAVTETIKFGCSGFVGTFDDLIIYNRVLSDDEITAYLAS